MVASGPVSFSELIQTADVFLTFIFKRKIPYGNIFLCSNCFLHLLIFASVFVQLAGQNSSGMACTPFPRTMKSGAEYQTTLTLEAWLNRHRSAGTGMCQELKRQ